MSVNVQQALNRYRAHAQPLISESDPAQRDGEIQRQEKIEESLARILGDPEGLRNLLSEDLEVPAKPRTYAPNEVAEEKANKRAEEIRPLAERYASILGQDIQTLAGQEMVERTIRFYSRNQRQVDNFKSLVAKLEQ